MGTGWLVITPQLMYTQATLGVGHQSRLGEKPGCETKRRKNRGREVKYSCHHPGRKVAVDDDECGEEFLQGPESMTKKVFSLSLHQS